MYKYEINYFKSGIKDYISEKLSKNIIDKKDINFSNETYFTKLFYDINSEIRNLSQTYQTYDIKQDSERNSLEFAF